MSTEDCDAFLKVAHQFKLGSLETEKPHPLTVNLSQEAQTDLGKAIASLKQVDSLALQKMKDYLPKIAVMGKSIHESLKDGGTVYLCGCGATGRLSISLEVFCRGGMIPAEYSEKIIGFMAGGDTALIKSIENFEDHPEYGARQLLELGFKDGDLLISITEGGETPFVIGATEAAASVSKKPPWFLYCNPEAQLIEEIERSAKVINHPGINSLSLYVGPMGLSGSTRMQASTVLMAAVGWALSCGNDIRTMEERLHCMEQIWDHLDLAPLAQFIKEEAECYQKGEYLIYETESFGVTVLTDTTERSPTFSLPPFENENPGTDPPAWCYFSVPSADSASLAWQRVLGRTPRCLDWEGFESFAGKDYFSGFYIGKNCETKRGIKTQNANHHRFKIAAFEKGFLFSFNNNRMIIQTPGLTEFEENLLLKLILNIQSTLIMGFLERFQSNLMTYVKPTNFKLIDRTIRYVQRLYEISGNPPVNYDQVAKSVFELKESVSSDEPIVLRVLDALSKD